jgi:hypothetical protein
MAETVGSGLIVVKAKSVAGLRATCDARERFLAPRESS